MTAVPGPAYDHPPLQATRPPRCPPFVEVNGVDDLLPYLDAVARRPYSQGLHAAWDLQPGERVLLHVSNWHHPWCVEAAERILERYGCTVEVHHEDRGPVPTFHGHDEVEYYLKRTKELMRWMDDWEKLDDEGRYDKILQGYGGPILAERHTKIQRMPFITPEMVASPAHTYPYEVLEALDRWTWWRITHAAEIRITDPEGTDIRYTNRAEYYDADRRYYAEEWMRVWYPQNVPFSRDYLPGHVWGRPSFHIPGEDGEGVIAGTMNHIGLFPRIAMRLERSRITEILGGGQFGDKLREVADRTADVHYPGFEQPGLLQWWEASIGTNPKIHRPREGFGEGFNCGLYERMRSGVIHIGYGTPISSGLEREADRQGLEVGHFHVHLYFPTVEVTYQDGSRENVVEDGRLSALDAPEIRELAARRGNPDELLREDWVPAVPGLNMDGDYFRDYAQDPEAWTQAELQICRRWHHLYMKMVSAEASTHECHP